MSYTHKNNRRKQSWNKNGNAGKNKKAQHRRGNAQKASTLDPALLVKKAQKVEETIYKAQRSIEDLPLKEALKSRLLRKGFVRPTEIQDKTLELLLEGRDLMGIAQTGTGKTGAFLMPIIDHLLHNKTKRPFEHALIIVPTRELALQVEEEFRSMTKGLRLFSACFIGGTNIKKDIDTLRRPSHVVIGTPGRLLDLNQRGFLDFEAFNLLVLDEFDRMLDMGFAKDMDRIIRDMHDRDQTMLFSATMDKAQENRIAKILHNPVHIKVSNGDTSGDRIEQDVIRLDRGEDKFNALCELLDKEDFSKVLLFDETKHRVRRLCLKLNQRGFRSDQIQGNKSQNARQKALKSFKMGEIQVLVATDVAARGIDVDDVTHVINYQIPKTYDSYIHRIGRTGRAGKAGKALTFVA